MKHILLRLAMAIPMVLLPFNLFATIYTGSCGAQGDNVTYSYDNSTYVLTISGSGKMCDFTSSTGGKWFSTEPYNFVQTVIIEEGVTSIGNYAFRNRTMLTSINFPKSLTAIGIEAFYGCEFLSSITFPESLTTIGSRAFQNCTGLKSITIPASVTSVGYSVFSGCELLEENFVNKSSISNSTWGVTLYKELDNGLRISGYSVVGCKKTVTSAVIPDGIYSINSNAFEGCSMLKSIKLPESLSSIGSGAFKECRELSSINIPSKVTSISSETFWGCNKLQSITLPDGLTSIGSDAFSFSGLTSIKIPKDVVLDWRVFYGCSDLTSVNIPSATREIKESCFSACGSLKSIIIPETVTNIESAAFSGCTSLISISLPESITTIESSTFYNCCSLASIVIPNGVTSIKDNAFYNCTSLRSVSLPETLTEMPSFNNPFRGCEIENLVYCANVSFTSNYLEGITKYLKSVTIGGKKTAISSYDFKNSTSLTSVTINNSVTSIAEDAFKNCPIEILNIDKNAFCNSKYFGKNLVELNIGENVTSIAADAFSGCTKLKAIDIPDNVMTLGLRSFQGCSAATSLKIGDNVEVIPANGFQNCTLLDNITLGSHVMNINDNAFAGDRRITTIKTSTFIPPVCASANVFDNYVYQAAELYVPTIRNAIARYKADGVWSKFFDIYEQDLDADPIYLEIKGMDGGVMKLLAEKGKEYTFVLEPMEDWIIHSVTFNGKDVTNDIINNIYNTPGITEDSELIIIFEEDPNAIGIKDTKENNIRVRAYQNVLEFVNSGAEEEAHIYTLNGMLVKVETINTGTTRIPMENHQTYIIRTASSSYKVSL